MATPSFSPYRWLNFRSYDPTWRRELALLTSIGLNKSLSPFLAGAKAPWDMGTTLPQLASGSISWVCYLLYFLFWGFMAQPPSSPTRRNRTLEREFMKSALTLMPHGSFLSLEHFFKDANICFEYFWIDCCLYLSVLTFQTACIGLFKAGDVFCVLSAP